MYILKVAIIFTLSVVTGAFIEESDCNFFSDRFWKLCNPCKGNATCLDIPEDECLQRGCCYAPESFVQAKRITKRCLRSTNNDSLVVNGTCIEYTGSCKKYFSTNQTTIVKRYIDTEYGMKKTDDLFTKFLRKIDLLDIKNKECLNAIPPSLCKYTVPICLADGSPQQICREDCNYMYKLCGEEMKSLLTLIQYMLVEENIDFSHLILPKCELLQYSWDIALSSNNSCGYLYDGLDRKKPVPTKASTAKSKVALYAATSSAVLLVITLVVTAYCLRKYRRRRLSKKTDLDFLTTMTSIRDRLRDESKDANPLLELIANSKAGELVQYPLDCVEYIQDLGEGQFGKVFQGRVHGVVKGEESTDVAVKCLKEGSTGPALEAFNQEVALMSVLEHTNVLSLLAVSTEEEPYCMIFEFMENGDLNEYLRKCKEKELIGNSELITICKHIAAGMEYLSSKKFLHRDLATRNCLVGNGLIVKIADFGMSRNIYHSDYYRVGGEAMLPIRWMPPEAILYGKFTIAADVYSFGVVMWEVFSFALQPFYGYTNEEVIEFIKKGVLLPAPEDCPEWIYNVMLDCWKREPEDRISFTKALQKLKGQFTDYDMPADAMPNTSDPSSQCNYDVVQATSDYDQLPYNGNVASGDVEMPNYQNLQCVNQKAPVQPNQHYQNVKTKHESIVSVNVENFDDKNAVSNAGLEEEESSLDVPKQSLLSNDQVVKSCSLKTKAGSVKSSGPKLSMHARAKSLGGGRSIKEILRDSTRYVRSNDLKEIGKERKVSAPEKSSEDDNLQSSITLSNDFLEYHGYGKNIQATDPAERERIKKIIEDEQVRRSSCFT